jgi:hypothetical protein
LIKYSLNVKRNEIERLESHLREEERALAKSEKHIGEDLALFDQFLDAWSRSASDAAFRYCNFISMDTKIFIHKI